MAEFGERFAGWKREIHTRILEYIGDHGKAYSRELRDAIDPSMRIGGYQRLLKEMEEAGELESWIVNPPHDSVKGGGLQRRYYRINSKGQQIYIRNQNDRSIR